MEIATFTPKTNAPGRVLFFSASVTFLASALIGMLASFKYGVASQHADWIAHLHMEQLRPLHLLLAVTSMVMGAMAITYSILYSVVPVQGKWSRISQWVGSFAIIVFALTASILILGGEASGREYAPWPITLSPLLLISVGLGLAILGSHYPKLYSLSPEGTVLLSLGWLLTFAGFFEVHSYLLPFVYNNGVRDLTSQWHGIDTFVAGINVMLYAGMIVLLQQRPKPLRKRFMFIIAGFGLLGTFGHHHYVSPQPGFLKIFAFLASMVAILSFVRHIHSLAKEAKLNNDARHPLMSLMLTAETWTIVAVGSGILFAIPQVNFYIHGTYIIIAHAMGSMIGINYIIIIGAGMVFCGYKRTDSEFSTRWAIRMLNAGLVLLWIGLTIPSLIKGISRTHESFQAYSSKVESWFVVFPISGLLLVAAIFVLSSELAWISIGKSKD